MSAQGLLVPAFVLLFGGAMGKSAQFPLNEWLLEAMTGPTAVSALIHAATMVKAGVFLVARIGPIVFALAAAGILADQFFEIIAWVGAITALLLATQGMVNPEIKKVLAYSTGSQIGYMMMALGVAGLSQQYVDGYTAGFFHMIIPRYVQGFIIHGCWLVAARCWFTVYDGYGRFAKKDAEDIRVHVGCRSWTDGSSIYHHRILEQRCNFLLLSTNQEMSGHYQFSS